MWEFYNRKCTLTFCLQQWDQHTSFSIFFSTQVWVTQYKALPLSLPPSISVNCIVFMLACALISSSSSFVSQNSGGHCIDTDNNNNDCIERLVRFLCMWPFSQSTCSHILISRNGTGWKESWGKCRWMGWSYSNPWIVIGILCHVNLYGHLEVIHGTKPSQQTKTETQETVTG